MVYPFTALRRSLDQLLFGIVLVFSVLVSICPPVTAAQVFRAGAFAVDITPQELPVIVNGGVSERQADEVHDPLHARCLVLDDGDTQLAIVAVDNCVMPRGLLDRAKALAAQATEIPADRILISATHTHSAPSVYACLGTDCDKKYAQWLPGKIAEGIQKAQKKLEPARVGWAVGRDETNVYCRRFLMKPGTARTNPYSDKREDRAQMNPGHNNPNAIRRTGPVDPEVTLLSIQTREGRPLALLANYSTHYVGAPALSADYFAVFAREIARLVGAGGDANFVGILNNGTSADANCLDFTRAKRRVFDYQSVGRDLARAAYDAYRTITYRDWVPLDMCERELALNVRMPTEEEITRARQFMKTFAGRKPRNWEEVYARETIFISEMAPTRELKLQALRIGDLAITAMPCEAYGSTGLALKATSPFTTTMNVTMANGYEGYIPPPEQHALGGYTTWRARSSCLEEMAEPKIKAALVNMLVEIAPAEELSVNDFSFEGPLGSHGTCIEKLGKNHFKIHLGHAPHQPTWCNMLYFKIVRNAKGKRLRLDVEFKGGDAYRFNHNAYTWSYDGENWQAISWCDPHDPSKKGDSLLFPEFIEDRVYFGAQVPFSYEKMVELIGRWRKHPHVNIHVLGTSLGGRDIYRLEITDPKSQIPRKSRWVHWVGNQHPGEHNAQWRIVGMVDWLLSDEGQNCRQRSICHFVPMTSVDGPSHGWYRVNAQGVDMNRSYFADGADPDKQAHEAYVVQKDLEDLMVSESPVTDVWSMHTWGGPVEPILLPGPEIGSTVGPWKDFKAILVRNASETLIEPLKTREKPGNSNHWNNGPHIQFGITNVLCEGSGGWTDKQKNLDAGAALMKSIADYYRGIRTATGP